MHSYMPFARTKQGAREKKKLVRAYSIDRTYFCLRCRSIVHADVLRSRSIVRERERGQLLAQLVPKSIEKKRRACRRTWTECPARSERPETAPA